MRFTRSILAYAAIALALMVGSVPAFATNGGDRGSFGTFEAAGFVGFGSFVTAGSAGSTSNGAIGGGVAESFGDSTAGVRFERCESCGGAQFSGFTTNTTGAQAQGPGANAWGNAAGAARGRGVGGFVTGGFGTWGGRR